MYKPFLSLALSVLLLGQGAAVPLYAQTQGEKESRRAEKMKVKIAKYGTGESARVRVTLRDRRRATGYIREAGAETFTLFDPKTGVVTVIPYSQVKSVNPNRVVPVVVAAAIAVGTIAALGALVLFSLKER
jgi:hypothetical protein